MEFQGHELEWLTLGVLLLTMIAIVYGPIKAVNITRNSMKNGNDLTAS